MRKALTVSFLLLALTSYSAKQNSVDSNPAKRMSTEPGQVSVDPSTHVEDDAAGNPTTEVQTDTLTVSSGSIPADMVKQLNEANRSFTYKGKPISALAVKELTVWLSDSLDQPGPVAIDLHGTYNTNRYYNESAKEKDGNVSIKLEPEGYFSYERLGTLKDNLHVLETWENGGGSGVFTNLLLIKFNIDYEYQENGSRRYRLVMQRMGEISLSDRFGGKIKIQPQDNSIRIGPSVFPSGEKVAAKVIFIK
jgi:hypothetical protein